MCAKSCARAAKLYESPTEESRVRNFAQKERLKNAGSRQDIVCEAALPFYINRQHYVEFLQQLQWGDSNVLEDCIYYMLTCVEVLALLRALAIFYIKIVMPLRFICAAKGFVGWSPINMNSVCDTLVETLLAAQLCGSSLMDVSLEVFSKVEEQQVAFREYLVFIKSAKTLSPDGKSNHSWYALANASLFDPDDATNQKTTVLTARFVEAIATGWLQKMHDPKGATAQYVGDGARSTRNVEQQLIDDTVGVESTNDLLCESVFGIFTYVFNELPNVAVESVSGIAAAKRNRFMQRAVTYATRKAVSPVDADADACGLFLHLDPRLRDSLMVMAMRRFDDVHRESVEDRAVHDAYYAGKREQLRAKEVEALAHETMNAIDSFDMYAARGTKTVVGMMKILRSECYKGRENKLVEYFKEQIKIRVVGFGWAQFSLAWSSKANPSVGTASDLRSRFEEILKYELAHEPRQHYIDRTCKIIVVFGT